MGKKVFINKKMVSIDFRSRLFRDFAEQYRTPKQIQKFIRTLNYNPGPTLKSAWSTWRSGEAHCMEAAFLASLLMEFNGFPPFVMSFESIDGLDHVISLFQESGKWGAIGFSRDEGLFGRRPLFQNPKALAQSYFDPYVDQTGCIQSFKVIDLDDTKSPWRFSELNVWRAERYLLNLKHQSIGIGRERHQRLMASYIKNGPLPKDHKDFWW